MKEIKIIEIRLILILLCMISIGVSKGFTVAFLITGILCGAGMLCLTPFLLAYFIVVWRDDGFKQALKECNPVAIVNGIIRESEEEIQRMDLNP